MKLSESDPDEHVWLTTDNRSILGSVAYNQMFREWTYYLMEPGVDGEYCWVGGDVSISTLENATAILKRCMLERELTR